MNKAGQKTKAFLLPKESYANVNAFWSALAVETLFRLGVSRFVISPGSRSTALTVASALHGKVETTVALDERSAAFFALGMARSSGEPVALICTSGTALAHYFPALIEAYYQQVPLVILSTDRPPELQDCQSGQTIDQKKIFGSYVNFFHDMALPEGTRKSWDYLLHLLDHAVTMARTRGPVHLNFPFREPLVPKPDATAIAPDAIDNSLFRGLSSPSSDRIVKECFADCDVSGKTKRLIVVGQYRTQQPEAFVRCLKKIADDLDAVILADILNPLRGYGDILRDRMICHYDAVLRIESNGELFKPDFILQVGVPPTSKILRSWMENICVETLIIEASDLNVNAMYLSGKQLHTCMETLHLKVNDRNFDGKTERIRADYLKAWKQSEKNVTVPIERMAKAGGNLRETQVASVLSRMLPTGASVIIANSLSIRNAEWFWPVSEKRFRFYCNRGTNGIDGTISTALGVANGRKDPAVLWVGDLAFLHDTNGLLLAKHFTGSLTIVLMQNQGGRIFEHLPIAAFPDLCERFFIVGQEVSIQKLTTAYGIDYAAAYTVGDLEKSLRKLPKKGVRVIECFVDPKENFRCHQDLIACFCRK